MNVLLLVALISSGVLDVSATKTKRLVGTDPKAYVTANCPPPESISEAIADAAPSPYDTVYKAWRWIMDHTELPNILTTMESDLAGGETIDLTWVEDNFGDLACLDASSIIIETKNIMQDNVGFCDEEDIDTSDPKDVAKCTLEQLALISEIVQQVEDSEVELYLVSVVVSRLSTAVLRLTYGLSLLEDALSQASREMEEHLVDYLRSILKKKARTRRSARHQTPGQFIEKECDASSINSELESASPLTVSDLEDAVAEADIGSWSEDLRTRLENLVRTPDAPAADFVVWLEEEWEAVVCDSVEPLYALILQANLAGTAAPVCEDYDVNDMGDLETCLLESVQHTISKMHDTDNQLTADSPFDEYYDNGLPFCRGIGEIYKTLSLMEDLLGPASRGMQRRGDALRRLLKRLLAELPEKE